MRTKYKVVTGWLMIKVAGNGFRAQFGTVIDTNQTETESETLVEQGAIKKLSEAESKKYKVGDIIPYNEVDKEAEKATSKKVSK